MEIITIPLYGALKHKDSMSNTAVIRGGDVQAMSAVQGYYIVNSIIVIMKR
jgi:redox-sensitive bicupin YhaK (pirin superfamily)